jgi:hypothetical protein
VSLLLAGALCVPAVLTFVFPPSYRHSIRAVWRWCMRPSPGEPRESLGPSPGGPATMPPARVYDLGNLPNAPVGPAPGAPVRKSGCSPSHCLLWIEGRGVVCMMCDASSDGGA